MSPSIQLRKIGSAPASGNDALRIKGEFVSATSLSLLDPASDGVRIVVLANDGRVIADIPIPGGAGWSATGGKKASFKDPTGARNGIVKFQVQDRSDKSPRRIRVQVVGKNGDYPVVSGDEPLRAIVVVGDGSLGECGETAFRGGSASSTPGPAP